MRVTTAQPAPIFPDDGPAGDRIIRRVRGIAGEIGAFVLVTSLAPLLVVVAAAVDLALWLRRRKPPMALRLLAFAWWFLLGELTALLRTGWIWLSAGGRDNVRRRTGVYNLRIWWAGHHLGGAIRLFGLKIVVDNPELIEGGPYTVMVRHASIIDNLLPDSCIAKPSGNGLRFVIKRELEMIPAIDIAGRWVPTIFVKRASGDADAEVAKIRLLADHFGPGEAIMIYPEGTRWTPDKAARVKQIIAERQPEISPLAERLQHLLPPRLGGPLELLDASREAGNDIIFCGHVGFDGFQYVSDIWAGGLLGTTVRIRFWRHSGAEIPVDHESRVRWLYSRWQTVDDWVGEHKQ